jgi:hypothetical protein
MRGRGGDEALAPTHRDHPAPRATIAKCLPPSILLPDRAIEEQHLRGTRTY